MLDRAGDLRAVKLLDVREPVEHEQLRPLDVIGRERGVGGAARQTDLSAAGVDDQTVFSVPFDDPADVSDVVREARDDEVRILDRSRVREQRAPLEDVVAGQGYEHRVLDVVIERVAVADALERELRRERNEFGQARIRSPEPILHVGGEERPQRVRGELGQRDHGIAPTKEPTLARPA